MSIPEGAQVCIREVWDRNVRTEFAHINTFKDKYPNVSIDTEFPGIITLPQMAASQEEHRYQTLRVNVDNMKLIQLGLTLTDERGNLPVIDGAHCIWQFNFRDFDIHTDIHSPPSIEMLISKAGINFEKFRSDGIDSRKFSGYLVVCDLVHNRNMRYNTFCGDYDFAYLLKLLTHELLPHTKAQFDEKVRQLFGTVCDLADLQSKHLVIPRGGLQALASGLGIKRIGVAHQAGPDSLLTASCFHKIKDTYFKGACPM